MTERERTNVPPYFAKSTGASLSLFLLASVPTLRFVVSNPSVTPDVSIPRNQLRRYPLVVIKEGLGTMSRLLSAVTGGIS